MVELDSEINLMKCGVVVKIWVFQQLQIWIFGWIVCCVCALITFAFPRYGIFHPSTNHIFATTPHFIKIISESDSTILKLHLASLLACHYLICSSYPVTCILHLTHLICLFTLQKIISLQPLHISSNLFQNLISPAWLSPWLAPWNW